MAGSIGLHYGRMREGISLHYKRMGGKWRRSPANVSQRDGNYTKEKESKYVHK
jgi:hypothetical protein